MWLQYDVYVFAHLFTLQESGRCVSDKCEEEKEEKGGVILKTQPKEMKLMSQL